MYLYKSTVAQCDGAAYQDGSANSPKLAADPNIDITGRIYVHVYYRILVVQGISRISIVSYQVRLQHAASRKGK